MDNNIQTVHWMQVWKREPEIGRFDNNIPARIKRPAQQQQIAQQAQGAPVQVMTTVPLTPAVPVKADVIIQIEQKVNDAVSAALNGTELEKLTVMLDAPVKSGGNLEKEAVAALMDDSSQNRCFFSDTIVPTNDEVAKRAYAIYLEGGCQPGQDAENWRKAEAQLDTSLIREDKSAPKPEIMPVLEVVCIQKEILVVAVQPAAK